MELIESRSIFSPATGFIQRGGFDWTCNPYIGCSFGWYARYTRSLGATRVVGLAVRLFGVSHVTARSLEAPITMVGVLVLLVAHVLNLRSHALSLHTG